MDSTREREWWGARGLAVLERLRLPGPSVLPVAGAVVGLYSGLVAGLFVHLIGLVSGLALGFPRVMEALRPHSATRAQLSQALAGARWEPGLLWVGVPLGVGALVLARGLRGRAGGDDVRRRLRVLGLLVLGALSLYYPLVALAAAHTVLGPLHDVGRDMERLRPWWVPLLPMVGGLVVGHVLRDRPRMRGHGLPEVVQAVEHERHLPGRDGVLKLVASALTIGTGGSAGREGPLVFGGAAFGSAVGRTLGFSRRELSVLLASGAGAGLAASFNAPIAGALFALEIILREFHLRVLSPIILASVTATLVGRGVLGGAPRVLPGAYSLVSAWEILLYGALGLGLGLLAYAFLRLLDGVEGFFQGRGPGRLSGWVGARPLAARAACGGLVVGGLALVHPAVWGTGHEALNAAAARGLSLGLLTAGCALKLVATTITLGSGGSGGTFFPMTVMGALAGGAFGEVLHALWPGATAPSGAYALVGMGGAVAALTRGPLTGLMMVYELSGDFAIILPLMVTCTLASALCQALVERRAAVEPARLRRRPIDCLVRWGEPEAAALPGAEGAPLPVRTCVVDALGVMDIRGVDTLPVRDGARRGRVTREDLRRFLQGGRADSGQP
ncbi:chloride channel protein [Melittangium boletus]|uniref:chloride channel protein n=1 Tax=Melittangium boletus TaxID=83453 RepID=UPI003DA463D3